MKWCGHWEMTAPDGNGVAICVRCGAAFPVVLTGALMREQAELVRRGPHSMACVDTPDGWCCAPDCVAERRCR
jgi:hypothetical protein